MEIERYLAMTAAEIANSAVLPPKIAWMACHFSPYGTGLSNLPEHLPEGSLLILNDRTPWWNHDSDLIGAQLEERIARLSCRGLLLDFQRPGVPEVKELTSLLTGRLACPVGVSEPYAPGLSCPVFLPPVPLQQPVEEYLAPWQGREIWLELALNAEEILLTANGSTTTALPFCQRRPDDHRDDALHCHYSVHLSDDSARFTLHRTREDLDDLLEAAAPFGITTAVGLWQELKQQNSAGEGLDPPET